MRVLRELFKKPLMLLSNSISNPHLYPYAYPNAKSLSLFAGRASFSRPPPAALIPCVTMASR
ncbi:uncharacterized protein M421DRAFT_320636 [Didymella exigua CBS 183.55]|uniref:Uncharacterized protein n=1 Tax=Didymella exigua CBS 183.55 TaxID=1150837 RepID=A0A6A5RTP2_9PLEO|nr:uncharacterized protein M421DRAFT_320636 [Didymella exigua CBS 183.55]KAF1931781.1 hypothetical protein M421DRAFT_320636 [Didymella exigua CBS 183.55]